MSIKDGLKEKIKNTKTYKQFDEENNVCENIPEEDKPQIEYNENGTVKRTGFSMGKGTIQYGTEAEKENLEKISKPLIICFILFIVFAIIIFIFAIRYCVTTPDADIFIYDVINNFKD